MSTPNAKPEPPLPEEVPELVRRALDLLAQDRPGDAIPLLERAQPRAADHPDVLRPLALAYHRHRRYLPALQAYDRLIELGAADGAVWCQTGNALTDVGEYAQAIPAYEHSLRHQPDSAEAHHNLARVHYRLGDLSAAIEHLQRAAALSDSLATWVSWATMIPACPGATHAEICAVRQTLARKLAAATGQDPAPRDAARATDPGGCTATPARPPTVRQRHPGGGGGTRTGRLRVGYVSSFFHAANYMKPVWGLMAHHDRSAVEIHLFSDSPPEQGLPGYTPHPRDHVHDTRALDNVQLANLIRETAIEIVVDLNAYSTPERLPLWLQPPAPVAVGWFNAYATSALPGLDYLIGDDEVIQPGEEAFYTERIWRLPVSYLTFDVRHPAPPVSPPPCLARGAVTFGSLVAQYKITGPVLDAWAAILQRVSSARLFLANTALKSPGNRQYVQAQFARRGIDPERLLLRGPAEHYPYLQYYDQFDVALDAFPYNGGTTTMEALWQGLPVITCAGDRWAARTSQSLLRRTHLGEFVTGDVAGYVALAVQLAVAAGTPRRLHELRRTMRTRLSASSACDTAALARALETCYRHLAGPGGAADQP